MYLELGTDGVSAVSMSVAERATLISHQETALGFVRHGTHSRAEA